MLHRTLTLVAAVLLALCAVGADATAAQRAKCNTDTDCVAVVVGDNKSRLLVDGLNFQTDDVNALLEKLPSWFGPKRPAVFTFGGEPMEVGTTFATVGVQLGQELKMYSAVEYQAAMGNAQQDL